MRRFSRPSLYPFNLAVALVLALCGRGHARAEVAEDLVVPSFRKVSASNGQANLIQFKVSDRGVASISVLARAHAKDGRVDQQIFELRPSDSRGAFPNSQGFQMWESDKIYASIHQWASNRGNLDRVEFSYVVHKIGQDQQRSPVESRHVYTFARGHELDGRQVADGNFARSGNNAGRGLDRLDAREVQAAVSRLAKRAPAARYYALPGGYPHPLHPQNQILKAIKSVTKAKRAHPERDYFIRFTVYNHDSTDLSSALVEAHRAGVRVEHLTDWSQTTPKLAGKPAQEMLRSAGIPVFSMVRNSPHDGDYRTNHSKVWLMGFRDGRGRIAKGTVFDCSFNTEFGNWPKNQEGMLVYRNNRDVATVYNAVVFQAMKGNAPLRLVIDPQRARFAVHHPLYPYVTPQGRPFYAYDALTGFIGGATRNLTALEYLVEDPGIVGALGGAARRTRGKAHALINGFWGRNAAEMRQQGVQVGRIFLPEGGSPVHHKLRQRNGTAAAGGSLNPARWSWQSDETLWVIRSKKVAKQVQAQANRLVHTGRYIADMWGGSEKPAYQTQKVQVEVRLPRGLRLEPGDAVYFAAGGSGEMDSSWLKLERAQSKRNRNKLVFRGSRRLPLGVIHHGKPVIVKRDGRQIFSNRGDTFFNVQPVKSGRQRVRVGFKR